MIKEVREELDLPIAIMLDTKGPEYRVGTFKEGKITLSEGASFTFTTESIEGDASRVSVSYPHLAEEMKPGDTILVNNGILIFQVDKVEGPDIHCTCLAGGEMSNRKSMSFPGKVIHQTYLSEQDKSDILFGAQNGVDFIACSFVSVREDLIDTIFSRFCLGK